jgi:predicted homoserine dehydrogenase-like protein
MTGPRAASVHEALRLFDLDSYGGIPCVDYLLGAEPNGGVYLIVRPKASLPEEQRFYLGYYKLGPGPRYVLYRPYHLCHLETPKAIFAAAEGRPILASGHGSTLLGRRAGPAVPTCEVFARAKRDLRAGETIEHAIGNDACYGLIDRRDAVGIPIALLEAPTVLRRSVARDEPLTCDHLDLPEVELTRLWNRQAARLASLADGRA